MKNIKGGESIRFAMSREDTTLCMAAISYLGGWKAFKERAKAAKEGKMFFCKKGLDFFKANRLNLVNDFVMGSHTLVEAYNIFPRKELDNTLFGGAYDHSFASFMVYKYIYRLVEEYTEYVGDNV